MKGKTQGSKLKRTREADDETSEEAAAPLASTEEDKKRENKKRRNKKKKNKKRKTADEMEEEEDHEVKLPLSHLPWQKVDLHYGTEAESLGVDFTSDGGLLSLEEIPASSYKIVDGKIVWKNPTPADQTTTKQNTKQNKTKGRGDPKQQQQHMEAQQAQEPKLVEEQEEEEQQEEEEEEQQEEEEEEELQQEEEKQLEQVSSTDVSAWHEFGLHESLLQGLASLGYSNPSPIQRLSLPKALAGSDILGMAETGSGKTLAFGLPLLNGLLTEPPKKEDGVAAIILSPTRELSSQIAQHLDDVLQVLNKGKTPAQRPIRVEKILGGMSMEKQIRILNKRPQVLVCTPGRLWALVREGVGHLGSISQTLRFLVVDEADRMFEGGHFPELKPLIALLERGLQASKPKYKRQTFLFSATLMLEDPKQRGYRKNMKRNKRKNMKEESKDGLPYLLDLMEKIGVRGKPALCTVDQAEQESFWGKSDDEQASVKKTEVSKDSESKSKKVALPEGLSLASVECVDKAKDNYLYYFLNKYQGRTVVFVNTISGLRRVSETLKLLQVENVHTLHAHMQQRQRLQHLEKFIKQDQGVLVATDVAARGLDIKGINYVVHYSIPPNADIFIHRSGRTARARTIGLCLALVGPTEVKSMMKIKATIGEERFSSFPVEMAFMPQVKERVTIAKRIELLERKSKTLKADRDWFENAAKAADMLLDDDIQESMDNIDSSRKKKNKAMMDPQQKELASLRANLQSLLQERLLPHFASTRYIATGDLHARSQLNQELISGKKEDAISTLKRVGGQRRK